MSLIALGKNELLDEIVVISLVSVYKFNIFILYYLYFIYFYGNNTNDAKYLSLLIDSIYSNICLHLYTTA